MCPIKKYIYYYPIIKIFLKGLTDFDTQDLWLDLLQQ